jgi:hypothetical protein
VEIGERAHGLDNGGVGVGGGNDLEKVQISRRVEEVRAEPVPAEIVASSFGEQPDRDTGRIRADDRAGAAHRVDAGQQVALDVEPFDDGFEDPVRVGDARKAVVEAVRGDQGSGISREERNRLERFASPQTCSGHVGGEIEQKGWNAGVRKVSGDLRTHHAGSEHRDRTDHKGQCIAANGSIVNGGS